MKKIFVFIFIIISNLSIGQRISELYFGLRIKNKFNIVKKVIPNPYILSRPIMDTDRDLTPYFGLFLNDKWGLEFEYSKEFVFAEYQLRHPRSSFGGSGTSVDYINQYSLFTKYKFNLVNNRLILVPKIGVAYVYSRYGRNRTFDGEFNWAQKNDDGTWTIEKNYLEWQIDYGFHKNYLFLNSGIEINYRAFKHIDFTLTGGYVHGFKVMGYVRGWYQIADEPKVDYLSSTKGSNFYVAIGTQMYFQPFKFDIKKEITGREYNYFIGISSVFEWIKLKDYISDFHIYYGPVFSIESSKLSTDLSLLLTSRNMDYNLDKYALTKEDFVNNTNTKLIANISDKLLRLQQNVYYEFANVGRSEFRIGLGYFFQKPFNVNGERKTVTASGIENKEIINEGDLTFGILGEINYSLILANRFKLMTSVSYQKYEGENNYYKYPLKNLTYIHDPDFIFNHWKNLFLYYQFGIKYRFNR